AFFRNVLDAAPNLIFVKTADGTHTFVNRSAAEAFGTTVEETVGRNIADLIPDPATLQGIREADQRALASPGETIRLEERIPLPDGRIRWNQTAKRAIAAPDGDGYQ